MLVSQRKRYLSGPDWVINALDRMMKDTTGAGNMSQIVLQLNGVLDENEVRSRLDGFIKQFPVLEGRVCRDLKLAPYWKIPGSVTRDAAVRVHHLEDRAFDALLLPLLVRSANAPFRADNDHLAFNLYLGQGRSALSMTFDHRIFDARGAELLLDLFQQRSNDKNAGGMKNIAFRSSSGLTQWSKKFLAGRNVNRRIIAMAKSSTLEALPLPANDGKRGYHYQLLSFDERETSRIYEQAYKESGYLMESPYLLAVVMRCMHELFRTKHLSGDSYLVPVTLDLRTGQDPLQEIFFNYVSYLFYQVPTTMVDDRKELIAFIKQQMYDQVKTGFPKDLVEASLLTRIAPLPLLGKALHMPMKGKMATFAFSHLGKSSYQHPELMGTKIESLFHMPRVPAPPGIGFFSNYFNNRFTMVISHLDGLLSSEEARRLQESVRAAFSSEGAR